MIDKDSIIMNAEVMAREGYLVSPEDLAVRDGSSFYGIRNSADLKSLKTDDILELPSLNPVFGRAFSSSKEINTVLLSKGRFTSAAAKSGRSVPVLLDDLAQLIGPGLKNRKAETAVRKLGKRNAVLVKDRGGLCVAKNLYDLHAVAMVVEKGCLAEIGSWFLGGGRRIGILDSFFMRILSEKIRESRGEEMSGQKIIFHNSLFDRISDDKKEKIINAAMGEFAENGFAGTNINKIAEKAGISIGALYKYFPTKENLYFSLVNLCFYQLEAELSPVLESDENLSGKIGLILDLLFDNAARFRNMNRLYNRFTSEGNSEMARSLAVRMETITARAYGELLSAAKSEGTLDGAVDERVFAFLIDNLFIVLQFSLSTEYYEDRMKIYLGDEKAGRPEYIKKQVKLFICRALGLNQPEGS